MHPMLYSGLSDNKPVGQLNGAKVEQFLPSSTDCASLHDEFIRVLVQHVPCLSIFKDLVPLHIFHKYSQEMSQVSDIVSLHTRWLECIQYKFWSDSYIGTFFICRFRWVLSTRMRMSLQI